MKPRLLRRALIFLYYVAFTLFLLVCSRAQLHAQAVSEQGAGASPRSAQADHQAQVDPLPPGCIHGTPAGEDPAVCCISGYVLLAGQPISNAVVTIATAQGIVAQVQTTRQDPTRADPYYRIDLAHLSQPITPTDVITIYASYEGMSSPKVRYTVQPGGQRLNLVMYDPNPNALTLSGQTQGQGAPGTFKFVMDVATDRWGNVYSLDRNQRVQVFDAQGHLLTRPNWQKGYGNLPNQLAEPGGIAIDPQLDRVYIADGRNRRVGVYTTDGDLVALWDGMNTPDHQPFGYPEDVAVDDQSNVYILTQQSAHVVYKFDPSGHFLAQWGTYGSGAGQFVYPRQIAITLAREILVTENEHTIYKFDSVGAPLPFAVTFPAELASSPVISTPIGIATGQDGSIYLLDRYSNQGILRHRVLQMNAQGVVTRAWNYPTLDPVAMNSGWGMTVSGDTLFLAGYAHHKIFRLNLAGGFRDPWGDIANNAGEIFQPHGVAIAPSTDSPSSLFVADYSIGRISRIVNDAIVQSWDAQAAGGGASWGPWNLSFDPQGRLYVVDVAQNLLYRYVISNTQLILDGGPWSGLFSNHAHAAIAIDKNNRIYLADPSTNRVAIFQLTTATTLTELASYDGSTALSGPLNHPQGLAVDDADPNAVLVYVADTDNHRLLVLKFANGALSYQASWGRATDSTHGRVCSTLSDTTLRSPLGVAVGLNRTVYVADTLENRVVNFDSAGNCIGQYGSLASGPDQMAQPDGIAVDALGFLYVADTTFARILHLKPLGPTKPVATIVHLSSADLVPGDVLTALGAGQAGDGTHLIDQYELTTSDGLAIISASPTVQIPTGETPTSATQLGPGVHQLQLRVHSDSGEWSEPTTYYVYVAHRRPVAATPPPTPVPGQTPTPITTCPAGSLWTFLLYLAADYADQGSLSSAYSEARAALATVNNGCVQFAIQIDGPASISQPTIGDTRRWVVRPHQPPEPALEIGEASTADGEALAQFIIWGQHTLPADHYYLAIADHGDGARGIAWDHTTDLNNNAYLSAAAIRNVLERTDIAKIDIVHLDACSMGLLDVAYQLREKVKYLLTSQYLGWGFFAYADYAQAVTVAIPPADLAARIVDRYAALAKHLGLPYTLAAWNLTRIEPVKNGVDALAILLKAWVGNDNNHARRDQLNGLRNESQSFNSDLDYINTPLDAYLDLFDWLAHLQRANLNADITLAATKLLAELQRADGLILANSAQSNHLPPQYHNGAAVELGGAHGVSLFYPLEGEMRLALPAQAVQSAAIADTPVFSYTQLYADYLNPRLFTFTVATHWDEFLRAAYGAPGPDTPLAPPSPPLAPLLVPKQAIYLPVVMR